MSRATESALDGLHGLISKALFEDLERAIARAELAPHDPDSAIPPQLLGQIIRFLASNGVNAPASAKRVDDLAKRLAALDIDLDDTVLTDRHPN